MSTITMIITEFRNFNDLTLNLIVVLIINTDITTRKKNLNGLLTTPTNRVGQQQNNSILFGQLAEHFSRVLVQVVQSGIHIQHFTNSLVSEEGAIHQLDIVVVGNSLFLST